MPGCRMTTSVPCFCGELGDNHANRLRAARCRPDGMLAGVGGAWTAPDGHGQCRGRVTLRHRVPLACPDDRADAAVDLPLCRMEVLLGVASEIQPRRLRVPDLQRDRRLLADRS